MFIDLHTHTLFSDGDLLPSELVARAAKAGYGAIALCDHVDFTNMDLVVPRVLKASSALEQYYGLKVITGCEITYVPPPLAAKAVNLARKLGARLVIVHGESPVEPAVPSGTNRAAILAGCDILAHPGFISEGDAKLAAHRGVRLEITARDGHSRGNACVARMARKAGAGMVLNTDAHSPRDLLTRGRVRRALASARLSESDYVLMMRNSAALVSRRGTKRIK